MTTIGFIGAGHIGSQVALALSNAGYDVILSNSKGPDSLLQVIADIPRAVAGTTEQAVDADLVVVAAPIGAFDSVPVEPLSGKTVLVTTNYNPGRDANIEALDNGTDTVPGLLQKRLTNSRVVRAFSMIDSGEVPVVGLPAGDPKRRALAIAGDDAAAKATVTEIYEKLGFDTVDLGGADEAWRVDRGQKAFVAHQTKSELEENARNAVRHSGN
jgi:8-hydroxy-5-deazaflavin:NADPH oxidoreductase